MIKKATENDIFIIEDILLNAVKWMDSTGLHQWEESNVRWTNLSKHFEISDFYIAYDSNIPVACMALIDHDPFFWPNIPQGESLYLHKIAVKRTHAGKGFSKELIDFAKEKAKLLGINILRLDCHLKRFKVRAVYEDEKTLFGKYETAFYICNL